MIEAPALTLSLILNPAPAPEGQLNPFSILKVRQAVQHLIDRQYIAREIYQGQASPMYTPNSPTDYDYLTVFDIIQKANLNYDPEFARAEIKDVMCYLRLIINPTDDSAFLRIINTPKRSIGAVTLEKLGTYAQRTDE